MIRFLADECCPKTVVDRLRADGHDVRYAAETTDSAFDPSGQLTIVEPRRVRQRGLIVP